MSNNDPVAIVAAKRTAIGSFGGSLSGMPAARLGECVIRDVLQTVSLNPADVNEVLMGQVLTAGCGQNPARQAAMYAAIPDHATAVTINQVCGSGLRTVAMGAQSILLDDAKIIIAGGQENMSLSPHCAHMRDGVKFGDVVFKDTMITDGLWDIYNDYHMGITAENVAEKFSISREQQDVYASTSQKRAQEAIMTGRFKDEITPVSVQKRKETLVFDTDEFPRAGVTAESLSGLRAAFKKDGTVTAGNASGINDGAAAVLLMRKSEAEKRGLEILACIKSWATAGVEPSLMGTGPIPASKMALAKAGWNVHDLDLIEANEAFAAQSCCVLKEAGFDPEKTNVNGGAIALGHPIGASGTRILVTLVHELKRRNGSKGLATLCIGGGMGIALCIER